MPCKMLPCIVQINEASLSFSYMEYNKQNLLLFFLLLLLSIEMYAVQYHIFVRSVIRFHSIDIPNSIQINNIRVYTKCCEAVL